MSPTKERWRCYLASERRKGTRRYFVSAAAAIAFPILSTEMSTAAPPPAGSPQNITREDWRTFLHSGGTLSGKVFPGWWLFEDSYLFPTDDKNRTLLKLNSCRLTGGGIRLSEPNGPNLSFDDCVIEGEILFNIGGRGLSVRMQSVEIGGRAYIGTDCHDCDALTTISLTNVKFAAGLILDSGTGHRLQYFLSRVSVAGDALFVGFPNVARLITVLDASIGGDMIFRGTEDADVAPADVKLGAVTVRGRLAFDECSLDILDLDAKPDFDFDQSVQTTRPLYIAGNVRFNGVRASHANLRRVVFHDDVVFNHCAFGDLRLDDAVFEDDVSFPLTEVRAYLSVTDTRFEKKLRLPLNQVVEEPRWAKPLASSPTRLTIWTDDPGYVKGLWLKSRPKSPDAAVWRNLRDAWRASNDTEAANEADYRRAYLETGIGPSFLVWGYGYRPARTVFWLCFSVLFFAVLYSLQMRSLRSPAARFKAGVVFSLQTAWKWRFGWEHTRGVFWRSIALAQQIASKVLLLLFLKALANTSPLLKEITDAILPVG